MNKNLTKSLLIHPPVGHGPACCIHIVSRWRVFQSIPPAHWPRSPGARDSISIPFSHAPFHCLSLDRSPWPHSLGTGRRPFVKALVGLLVSKNFLYIIISTLRSRAKVHWRSLSSRKSSGWTALVQTHASSKRFAQKISPPRVHSSSYSDLQYEIETETASCELRGLSSR